MFKESKAFSSFSIGDLDKSRSFYKDTLGLEVAEPMGQLALQINGGIPVFLYTKPNHQPATFTVLNFPVEDINKAVDELIAKGVVFEQYHYDQIDTDEKGIAHGEPKVAWFKDPAGNILSVIEKK